MNFTAKDVAALREKTGCGMMDCKKALTASNGDVDAAIDFLREKGLAASAKKASRIAAEGVAYAKVAADGKSGVVIEINAETDFVAKNADFRTFVETCADTVLAEKPADVDALMDVKAVGTEMTVAELLREKILTIGENIKIRRFTRFDGVVATYIHAAGRIGVMVQFDADEAVAAKTEFEAFAKDICMQVAAANPAYLCECKVPAEVVEHEKKILMEQIANDPKTANKPAQVIEKMVTGRIAKYYKENCLVDQIYVKDPDLTVQKYVDQTAKALGGKIAIADFVRYEKGEGLEKRNDNFADEVAGMIK